MLKKLLAAGTAFCLAAGILSGCSSEADASDVVASVGDTDIELGLVNFLMRYNQAQLQTTYGAYLGEDYWQNYGADSRTSILENIETMVLSEQHMEDYGVSLTEEEETAISDAAAAFMEGNEEDVLTAMSADQETVERAMTLYTINQKVYISVISEADTEVSDEEAAQKTVRYVFFSTGSTTDEEGNTVEMTDEEKEEVRATAQQVLDAVKSGTSMDDALEEAGEDRTSITASYGEDNGSLSDMLKEAANELTEDGQVADSLIEIDTGYYVLQMESMFDEEATETRKDEIVSERRSDHYTEVTDGWREDTEITVNEDLLAQLDFDDTWQLVTEETETETAAETTDETSAEPAESETAESAETETTAETETETAAESASETETEETAAETESETAVETESESETETETETESESETVSETEA
ncbi:MAG TPA: peptidyl-prolyl cis-trans isomerase [Candidatus Limivivens intestinipullorum]|uniref:Peptidyl-prolyl cis-trans isomerase n=1 Tax=Candidatus Limivivens intestinipullorum TaxID=2840858 RepID=A0A9D1JJL0_9FIRM|nr:peptidyl-prolyl cis-trans isomerase [Candidatus Limivivens intestinipullorum]